MKQYFQCVHYASIQGGDPNCNGPWCGEGWGPTQCTTTQYFHVVCRNAVVCCTSLGRLVRAGPQTTVERLAVRGRGPSTYRPRERGLAPAQNQNPPSQLAKQRQDSVLSLKPALKARSKNTTPNFCDWAQKVLRMQPPRQPLSQIETHEPHHVTTF